MSDMKSFFDNEKSILQLFFNRRQKILFTIALNRILKLVSGQVSRFDSSLTLLEESKPRDCWICWEKVKLFAERAESLEKKVTEGSKETDNIDVKCCNSDTTKLWKQAEHSFGTEGENESKMFEELDCDLPENEDTIKKLLSHIIKQLESYKQEFNVGLEIPFKLEEKPGFVSFAVNSRLKEQELTKYFSSCCIRTDPKDDQTSWVVFDICRKCLRQISFDVKSEQSQSTCCKNLLHLFEHLSSLASSCITAEHAISCKVKEKNSNHQCQTSEKNTKQEDITNPSLHNSQPKLGPNSIKITVVRCKELSKGKLVKIRPKQTSPLVTISNTAPTTAQNVQPSLSFSSNPTKTFAKNIVVQASSNATVLSPNPVLNSPKSEYTYFKFPPLKHPKLRFIKPVGPRNFSRKGIGGLAAMPFQTAPIFLRSNGTCFNKMPVRMVTAKPLATLCPNSIVAKGKLLTVLPRVSSINQQQLRFLHSSAPPNKETPKQTADDKSISPLVSAKQSQSTKRKKAHSSVNARKRVKKEDDQSKSTSISKSKTNTSEKSTSQKSTKTFQDNQKTLSKRCSKSQAAGYGKMRIKMKPPSKKRPAEKLVDAVPMKTIVSNYLTSTSNNNTTAAFTTTSSSARRRRSKPRSAKKLIPVPYEAHYLCIYQTLAKKGWKAYWYQKCRCARGEKKKAEADASKEQRLEEKVLSSALFKDDVSLATVQEGSDDEKNVFAANSTNYDNSSRASDVPNAANTSIAFAEKETDTGSGYLSLNQTDEIANGSADSNCNASSLKDNCCKALEEVGKLENKIGENFEVPSSVDDCGTSNAFNLPILTMQDIKTALSQFDENAISNLCDSDKSNFDVIDDAKPKPNFETMSIDLNPKSTAHGKYQNQCMQTRRKEAAMKSNAAKRALCKSEKQEKVDAIVGMLMKCSSQSELVDRVVSSRVFAQSLEEIDKQPGCLDLISVNPVVVNESSELCSKVTEYFTLRKSRKSSLLNSSKAPLCPSSKSDANDLECIWAFGKSNSYFTESAVTKSYAKTRKAKIPPLPAPKKTTRPMNPYLAFKRTMKKFTRNNLPKRKTYRHHSQRPKASVPIFHPAHPVIEPKQEEHFIGIQPYIVRWDIPKISRSEVVEKLENVWGEVTGFTGLLIERLPPSSANLLTSDRLAFALTAIKDSSEIFTFSSKPKDGQNTVLLIRRKMKVEDNVTEKSDCEVAESIPSFATTSCADSLSDVSSNSGQSKILLKLRKTGEVSGSAIYSVSDSDEFQDDLSSSEQESTNEDQQGKNYDEDFDVVSRKAHYDPTDTLLFETTSDDEQCGISTSFQTQSVSRNRHESSNHFFEDEASKMGSSASKEESNPPASPNTFPCSSPATYNQSALEDEFDQSCSDLDLDGINGVLQSTMMSPKCDVIAKTDLMTNELKLKFFSDSDFFFDFDVSASDEKEITIVDWDGKLEGKDDLEELLLSINENSFDALEQIFVFESDFSIPPSELMRMLKLKSQNNSCHNESSFYRSLDTCSSPYLNLSCSGNGKRSFYDASSTSPYQFKENFSFDSPEIVRGSSHSKSSGSNPAPFSDSVDAEGVRATPPASMCHVNGESSQELENSKGSASSVMKACNVLLEPLEEMLERNGSQNENMSSSSKIRFTESSVRELNRLLKNRALNGAYWKSMDFDSSSSSSSSGRWRFRDRNKKKEDTPSVEIDLEVNVESVMDEPDLEVEEESEPEVQHPKRKSLGKGVYYHPLDLELKRHLNRIYIISNEETDSSEGEDSPSKEKLFKLLLTSELNLADVRQAIVDSTLSHPRSLRSSAFFARKAATFKRQALKKTNVHLSSTAPLRIENQTSQSPPPKRMKKIAPETSRNASKLSDYEEFNSLRQQLFQLRHPNYKGDICGDGKKSSLNFEPSSCRLPLKLVRVSADEARKQTVSSLTSDILLHHEKSPAGKVATAKRRGAQKSTGANKIGSVTCAETSQPRVMMPQVSLESIFNVSSRGRSIKPLSRSPPQDNEHPKAKKRRRSEDIPDYERRPRSEPSPPIRIEHKPRSRFVDKHSSSGLFIKKIIESGLYE